MTAPGVEQGELQIVAAGQRKADVGVRVDHRADFGRLGLQQRRFAGHLDGFAVLAQDQLHIDDGDLVELKFNGRLDCSAESWRGHAHFIASDGQIGEIVKALRHWFLPARPYLDQGRWP